VDIFAVVSNHINWLGQRQAITAANIANSDTPNFRAKEIQPFHLQIQDLQTSLQQTQVGHMQDQSIMATGYEIRDQHNTDANHSGNDVVIEKEMLNVITEVGVDKSAFRIEHNPGHPAADANGNVKMPNVNMIVEMTDMKQATRSYEANLQVIKQGRDMSMSLIDLLRGT
jgi:flagellar basal-body rod protein FlgC